MVALRRISQLIRGVFIMARTEIPVTTLNGNPAGVATTTPVALDPAAAPNGNVISNIGPTLWLELTCTVAGPVTVTLVTPGDVQGRAVADDTLSLSGIGSVRKFGPFSTAVFGTSLQINGPATVTAAAYQLATT
jgi:hypothetical protein